MKDKIIVKVNVCKRCGYRFFRIGKKLKKCPNPKCRTKYWNKKRIYNKIK